MDQELWTNLKAAVDRAVRAVPAPRRTAVFSDRLIVLMLLWAVWHDRCLSWACDRKHYGGIFRPRALPSISRFARRVKTERVQQILHRTHEDLATRQTVCPFSLLSYVDAKPVPVSPVSKDPDAKRGRISGGFAKGYKLHTIVSEQRRVLVWCVSPLNTDEKVVAEHLVNHLPSGHGHCDSPAQVALESPLTLGDSSYDSANLHKAFTRQGRTLLTPLRCEQRVGPNGRPEDKLRKMGIGRRQVIEAWENHAGLARYVMKSRNNIEGTYSVLSLACGLDRLPGFVRRLDRVRRWIGCKILLYHARLLAQAIPKPHAA
jgi:hypothetical protein